MAACDSQVDSKWARLAKCLKIVSKETKRGLSFDNMKITSNSNDVLNLFKV